MRVKHNHTVNSSGLTTVIGISTSNNPPCFKTQAESEDKDDDRLVESGVFPRQWVIKQSDCEKCHYSVAKLGSFQTCSKLGRSFFFFLTWRLNSRQITSRHLNHPGLPLLPLFPMLQSSKTPVES